MRGKFNRRDISHRCAFRAKWMTRGDVSPCVSAEAAKADAEVTGNHRLHVHGFHERFDAHEQAKKKLEPAPTHKIFHRAHWHGRDGDTEREKMLLLRILIKFS